MASKANKQVIFISPYNIVLKVQSSCPGPHKSQTWVACGQWTMW